MIELYRLCKITKFGVKKLNHSHAMNCRSFLKKRIMKYKKIQKKK